MQTPILWLHGTDDKIVLFEAGESGSKFLQELGMSCEFKVILSCFVFLQYQSTHAASILN
jgi:alpha-beta hydrolase superfamily lysophospholipase